MFEVTVKTEFAAAHRLIDHPGPCREIHGHNWKVEAAFAGAKLDKQGMVIDFADVMKELDRIKSLVDHRMINEVPPFDRINPTAENIAKWIFDELAENLPTSPARVTVHETDSTSASYSA